MDSSGSVFSDTLQSITTTKLEELSKKRASFEAQYSTLLAAAQHAENPLQRMSILVEGVKSCLSVKTSRRKSTFVDGGLKAGRVINGGTNNPRLETDLKILDRFLEQARYDPSVFPRLQGEWDKMLLQHLSEQSLKLEYATLYGRLVTEWLLSEQKASTPSNDDVNMSEAFEEIPASGKLESRAAWERSVFEPYEIDQAALSVYLNDLFGKQNEDKQDVYKAFKKLQQKIESFETDLAAPVQFSHSSLNWAIQGLLSSDLLIDEQRAVLKDFAGNPTILSEIADVLNMRMAALSDWTWGDDVLVEQRRKLNGTYNIYLHEDLLQAIFLQFIGVKWSVFFKGALKEFRRSPNAWKSPRKVIPKLDRKRRDYYLGPEQTSPSIQSKRGSIYRKNYFLSQLPDSEYQEVVIDEGDEEADFDINEAKGSKRTMQTPLKSTGKNALCKKKKASKAPARSRRIFNEDSESENDYDSKPKRPMDAKQSLLHLLSTEIIINSRIHGELTCFHSVLDEWNPRLPHRTILTVLAFFGVSEKWLAFFKNFLEAPLKFIDEPSSQARIRRRGTPGSHSLSDVFGEVILFSLDFSINQNVDGALLYRMHDDFWFWSPDHDKCVAAWKTVTTFTKVMGVSLSKAKTGTVRIGRDTNKPLKVDPSLPTGQIRWGFLYLDPQSGRFEIDQSMIDSHINELRLQLQGKTKSIFGWIRAWNTYAATFFATNFGRAANCYGREHVDKMLSTHERIHHTIFASIDGSASVVEYLKKILQQRFGVTNIPDGFLFFPIELGGLNLQSPFVSLLQIRDTILERPSDLLHEFEENERDAYHAAKTRFEKGEVDEDRYELDDPEWKPASDEEVFMSFEEFTRYREEINYGYHWQLSDVFDKLLIQPTEERIEPNAKMMNGLNALAGLQNLRGILPQWYNMEPYWMWVAQIYGPEMMDQFGGLNIVDPGLLPMGLVSLYSSRRVNWHG